MSGSDDNTKSGSKQDRKNRFKQTTMGQYMDVESSSSGEPRTKKMSRFRYNSHFFRKWSDEDTKMYRAGYPGKKDHLKLKENLLFYKNEMKSHPDGDYIDSIHKHWWGDHYRLEQHHGYIQWLFPIRESGMNFYSQELQLHECRAIIADKESHARVLKSYEMMLEFYGMELADKETGIIKRGDNWKSRFRHLNSSYHNYLRITRMLKSLGEFDYEYLKKPFVEFVLQEAFEEGTLENTLESCCNYWIGVIKSDKDRDDLMHYIQKMEEGYGTKHPPNSHSDDDDSDDMKQYPTSILKYTGLPSERQEKESDFSSNTTGSTGETGSTVDSEEMRCYQDAADCFGKDVLNEVTGGKSGRILRKTKDEDMEVDERNTTSDLQDQDTDKSDVTETSDETQIPNLSNI